MSEWLHHPLENAVHISQGHAVVANRNALIDKEIGAVEELLARTHATAALDGHGIFIGVGDGRQTRHIFKINGFAREFPYHSGQLHTPDVFAGAVVGARFEEQNRIAILAVRQDLREADSRRLFLRDAWLDRRGNTARTSSYDSCRRVDCPVRTKDTRRNLSLRVFALEVCRAGMQYAFSTRLSASNRGLDTPFRQS